MPTKITPRDSTYLPLLAAIAASYALTAKVGFTLAFVAEQVTVVWPPSGIALAASLLFGRRIWPGVWLGAFLANVTSHEGVLVAAAIATGNTLEAVTGAWLLDRAGEFDLKLGRLRDVFALAVLAAGLSTLVSATIGTLSLCAGGVQPWNVFPSLFRTWWLGDAMGDLVVVPVVLGCAHGLRGERWRLPRIAEGALLVGGLIAVCEWAFGSRFSGFTTHYPLGYIVFPFLIWAALRFGQLGTATAVLIASTTAIWATVEGRGPFVGGSPHESLMLVQMFLSVVAMTTLLLGAAMTERKTANARLLAEYRVAQAIAGAGSLEDAAPRILEAICADFDWDLGGLWRVDHGRQRLECVELWHRPGMRTPAFDATSATTTFPSGVGLPGRVWATGKPAWIPNVTEDANFPRAPIAAKEGLHGAFGFPVVLEGSVVAVLEFFSREIRQPDAETLRSFAAIGSELGQYIGRKRVESSAREGESQRERAEEALRKSEERLRSILDNAPLAVSIKDPGGRYTFRNRSSAVLWAGLVRDSEVLGKTDHELFPREVAERFREDDLKVIEARGALEFEETIPSESGRRFWLTNKFPLFDPSGALYAICGISMDITSRREAEEALKTADRRKDEFLATLAHELRNPLAPVRNAVEIIRLLGPQDSKLDWAREVIDRQVTHLARLVDDLLDVARITTRKITLHREPIEVAIIVTRAVEAVRPLIVRRRHRLSVAVPGEPIHVAADLVRLSQVVGNLLDNAAKYTDEGGEISLVVERVENRALIRVKDTGIGMPAEVLPRVFDLFTQADRSLDRSQGGLGIGLTVVRQLVEMHGGSVQAHSDGPGLGAEFVVALPLLRDFRGDVRDRRQGGGDLPFPPRRVLVVDDNVDSAESVRAILMIDGHDVRTAHDGEEALRAARTYHPEVVVLDIGLPGMDGYEVAQRLKHDPRLDGIFLIALTGYGQEADRRRSDAAGFDAHLTKPTAPDDLRALVARGRS